MVSYAYSHWDVFTDTPFTGNPLAVFLDGAGLLDSRMQRIANELNLSETTFVLAADNPGSLARVRIFTPSRELPMAGHPTIGTTFALAGSGLIVPGTEDVTLDLGVGPTAVSLDWQASRLRFAWMTQAVAEFGAEPTDIAALARALGVDAQAIRASALPAQVLSSGVPFLYVPLVSRDAVDRAQPERAALASFCAAAGLPELPVFVFTLERGDDDATVYCRMFAPAFGVAEDPATGGASGPLGCYLVHHRAVTPAPVATMVSLQGVRMGRPSRIHIKVESANGRITSVKVGGSAVLVAQGTLTV